VQLPKNTETAKAVVENVLDKMKERYERSSQDN
jgi:hypothetical protein